MTYYSGFVAAVPIANKQAYREHAGRAWPFFQKWGARRLVECWGEDIRDGKLTDFRRAVQAKDDEAIVFGWIEWPERATADSSWEKMQADPQTAQMGDMPYDGARMIWGGFAPVLDETTGSDPGYYLGFLVAVPTANRQAYMDMARMGWDMFRRAGAVCQVEAWGEDVPQGKLTDFHRSVQAADGEAIVFSWVGWPDRATADAAEQAMQSDPAIQQMGEDTPFDGSRMVWVGFAPILDERA